MCYDALEFDAFSAAHGIDFRRYFATELSALGPLVDDGLIEVDAKAIHIQPKGRLLLRNIAMKFDRHLDKMQETNRFSRAI